MNIKFELLSKEIAEAISKILEIFDINENKITDSVAVCVLSEIKDVINNDRLTDFDMVHEIVNIFKNYNIDSGSCHDAMHFVRQKEIEIEREMKLKNKKIIYWIDAVAK